MAKIKKSIKNDSVKMDHVYFFENGHVHLANVKGYIGTSKCGITRPVLHKLRDEHGFDASEMCCRCFRQR